MDLIFQLIIMVAGYILGSMIVFVGRLFNSTFSISSSMLLFLVLPIASAFIAEAIVGRWQDAPGSMGLGGLTAFMPMLLSGFLNGVVAIIFYKFIAQLNAVGDNFLIIYLSLLVGLCTFTMLLWRFWPLPVARLW